MNTRDLFTFLSTCGPLSEELKKALSQELTSFTFPKNHILHSAPDVCEYGYFINRGFAISFSYEREKRFTENIWQQGEFILSFKSFFEQVPSAETVQLVDRSEVLRISYASMRMLLDTYPEVHPLCQRLTISHADQCMNRIRDMQRLTAWQRFEKLIDAYPHIEQLISQDSIASYLGIAGPSLSRLKRDKGKP